jgi:serine/threonine protein kinase/beta-lactam-binding protein with PASTA domain
MIGRVLNNRYKLLSLLGEGGMAVVYEAEDLLLGRKVAVKVLREQYASDPGFLARFQREARSVASLSHPNIVAVYDVGTEGTVQYIVMELIAGRTLKEIILEEAPLGAARVIHFGRQICDALAYAHRQQIVHRDVKPHNILVTEDGRAKIADFGIAMALGASSLTQSGYVVGSAHYISPEQAQGDPITAYSDLYSAGVVLYEMATGRLPFEGETSVAVALKQVKDEPAPPRRYNPRIPESLQSVILRSMAKNPHDRYGSGAEMSEALLDCARASMEATQAHPAAKAKMVEPDRSAPPVRTMHQDDQKRGRGGWMVLVVVLAAFLCTLGSIPLGILAISNGMLGSVVPGPSARPAPTATTTPAAVAPTAMPTSIPTITPTPTVTPVVVPDLVGIPFSTARQHAQDKGLDVVIIGETHSTKYPVAYVVSQKPEKNDSIEKGGRIEVVVSLGAETALVPRVVELTLEEATRRLREAGFTWRVSEEISNVVPAGVVISQTPAPDVREEKGVEIHLRVSKGKEKVAVPNVVGMTEAEAQAMIENAGLTTTWVNYQDFPYVPPGHVLSQDPKPETMVEKGTIVYIAVRRPQSTQPPPSKP